MKKKMISMLLALLLTVSALTVFGSAAGSFSDVTDEAVQCNVEVLRMLGIVCGDGEGRFHPNATLTRAEFCKMAVVMTGNGDRVEHFKSITIFPDVRANNWAAGYINLAVRETKLIAGNPDGSFAPNRPITFGEAVTILCRVLGYTDADSGSVWPAGYLALGRSSGLTDGMNLAGNSPLKRAESAQLFVNLLNSNKKAGGKFLPEGYTKSEETKLISVIGTKMRVSASTKSSYEMETEQNGSPLVGLTGYVLIRTESGKAVAFLPTVVGGKSALPNTAVIVGRDGSTVGFAAITGERTGYSIYKNGRKVTTSDLRKGDVATYNESANMISVCDTRVSVYYDACTPNPSEPAFITVLGHEFPVLPIAYQSVSAFKPGNVMTILLTADGRIAGALPQDDGLCGNAIGLVKDGELSLLCGGEWISLDGCKFNGNVSLSELDGRIVGISSVKKDTVNLSEKKASGSASLSVSKKMIGSTALAENVILLDCGEQITLDDYTDDTVPSTRIAYYRTAWDGRIDLVATDTGVSGTLLYGLVKDVTINSSGVGDMAYSVRTVTVDAGGSSCTRVSGYNTSSGRFVEVVDSGDRFTRITELEKLSAVSARNWLGDMAVTYRSKTYEVPASVLCYNTDSRSWISLEEAKAYAGAANLYVKDNVVRVVEVKS